MRNLRDAAQAIQVDILIIGKNLSESCIQIQRVGDWLTIHGLLQAISQSIIRKSDDGRLTIDGGQTIGAVIGVIDGQRAGYRRWGEG